MVSDRALAQQAPRQDLVIAGDGEPDEPVETAEPVPGAEIAQGSVDVRLGTQCLRPHARCKRTDLQQEMVSLFGLRGSETLTEVGGATAGLSLASLSASHGRSGPSHLSARFGHFALIGGGRGGVEGGLGFDLAMGLTQDFGKHHGPYSRLGARGHLLGNSALYLSSIELPQVQLGYQLLDQGLELDLGGRVGPVLAGRYNPDGARRKLGGAFEYGALATAAVGPVHLDLEWSRVEARDTAPGTPVDVMVALLCGGHPWFGACLDLRRISGDLAGPGPEGTRRISTHLGLTLGAYPKY